MERYYAALPAAGRASPYRPPNVAGGPGLGNRIGRLLDLWVHQHLRRGILACHRHGIALELGKLRAVTWIGRNSLSPTWGLKGALAVLVIFLMGLNVVGAFGFLAKAHIGHEVEGDIAVASRAADIEGRISVQADLVADLDRRIGQIDGAVEKSTAKGRTNAAMQLAADQRRNRAELAAQRDQANKVLAELKIEKAKVDGDRKVV